MYGQCEVPPDLGPVVTVASGYFHTCAVKASGELVCFGSNKNGQCEVPPDLGPVVAVAAGPRHTCAVKANGELVCVGETGYGQCDVPPGFKVWLAPQAIRAPTPDPTQGVLQPVHHEEPPADISEEESAAKGRSKRHRGLSTTSDPAGTATTCSLRCRLDSLGWCV